MGEEVSLGVSASLSSTTLLRSGKVRSVACSALMRASSLPEMPTIGEQGFPGFRLTNRYNFWTRAGTPRPIVLAINRVVSHEMHTPQIAQKLAADGSEPAKCLPPEKLKTGLAQHYVELER